MPLYEAHWGAFFIMSIQEDYIEDLQSNFIDATKDELSGLLVRISYRRIVEYCNSIRLYDETFRNSPVKLEKGDSNWEGENSIDTSGVGIMVFITKYMLDKIHPQHNFKREISRLFSENADKLDKMLLPQNWERHPVWES